MALPPDPIAPRASRLKPLPRFIFASRWLQMPLYIGLILAQGVYVFHFWVELVHLVQAAFGSEPALTALVEGMNYQFPNLVDSAGTVVGQQQPKLTETVIMLAVLSLIDVVMISNLLIMVIVGGYETFVSRLGLEGHRDEPDMAEPRQRLVLKVKLGTAIIGISSIHLLRTFINAGNYSEKVLISQTVIHLAFLLSAIAIAYTDKLLNSTERGEH